MTTRGGDIPRYIGQSQLVELLADDTIATAIVDCRDRDRNEGGWISGSIHFPSKQATEEAFNELLERLKQSGVQRVVFHCMFSQARGPGAAQRFVALFPPHVRGAMQVMILDGGFRGFYHWAEQHHRTELIERTGYGFL
jgi:rhodanese-related sulfurtransferase